MKFDLGININDLSYALDSDGLAKIVGFRRSGKSTLAEIISRDIERKLNNRVLLQDATKWLFQSRSTSEVDSDSYNSVDIEVTSAIAKLESEDKAYWVLDNAEVFFAYCTERMLNRVSKGVAEGAFKIVLIRNRFIHEHSGWFSKREDLLHPQMMTFFLYPLSKKETLTVSQKIYAFDRLAPLKAIWLQKMSGGIPGLISELAPLAPNGLEANRHEGHLLAAAKFKRQELNLDAPVFSILAKAISGRILPPEKMLVPEVRPELGVLIFNGIVHKDYYQTLEPVFGEFWNIVINIPNEHYSVPDRLVDKGINLVLSLQQPGLDDDEILNGLAKALGLPSDDDTIIAQVFSAVLFCKEHPEYQHLIISLDKFLADFFGAMQLQKILIHNNISNFKAGSNAIELAQALINNLN